MQTIRPLSFGQRNIVANVRQSKLEAAEKGDGFKAGKGDRESFSYIDQFADRTIGVALGITHTKEGGNGRPNFNSWGGWAATVPYNGQNVVTPGGFTTDIETLDSDRDAAVGIFQFKPNKNFESIVDVFYSKGKFALAKRGLEGPLGGLSAGANDSGGALTNATIVNGVATAGTFTNWRGVIRNHNENYTDELTSIGWGNKLKLDNWSLNGDLSHSHVVKDSLRFETTAGLPGNVNNPNDTISYTGFNGSNFSNVKYSSGLNYSDPNLIKLTDVQGWAGANGVQDGYYAAPKNDDTVNAFRLSASHDLALGPLTSVDFGANQTDRKKLHTTREGALIIAGALNPDGSVANRFASANIPNATVGNGGGTGIPTLNWDPTSSLGSIYTLNPWTDHDIVSKNWSVSEKVSTFFAKGDLEAKLGSVEMTGNVGLQFIATRQGTTGSNIDQASCNGGTHTCSFTPFSRSKSYTDTLPSLNLAFDFGGDNKLRVAAGRMMVRPNMEDMKATIDFNTDTTSGTAILKGTGGNPDLQPFRANAIDVSYEKYFGNKGYVSVAGFYKDLRTFIIKRQQVYDFRSYLTPTSVIPAGGTVGLLTSPYNGTGGKISGIELAVNVPFSLATQALDGFGVMVNYSNTNSNVSMPASGFSTTGVSTLNIPLPGLSKEVTNLRAYYEKYGFQISIAQRKRSNFLGEITDYQDNTQLKYVKGETTYDVQMSYEFSTGMFKGLSLVAIGNNVTNQQLANYSADPNQITDVKKFGATYTFGLNYKF
jgi:iron complex outermembrane receptor protein